MGKREQVWADRQVQAEKLSKSKYFDGDEDAALNLILRTIRWSLRRAHQWERANTYEEYCNSKRCDHDEALIKKLGDSLDHEWKKAGYQIKFYGLYPTIQNIEDKCDEIHLAYFD